jgi:hypothetical protein
MLKHVTTTLPLLGTGAAFLGGLVTVTIVRLIRMRATRPVSVQCPSYLCTLADSICFVTLK